MAISPHGASERPRPSWGANGNARLRNRRFAGSSRSGVARTLSRDLNLRLVLAHVAPGFVADGGDSLTMSHARSGGDRLLERLDPGHDLHAERRVEVGDAPSALAQIAAEEAATLIVIGARRRVWRGLRGVLAGELAASAPCPVVIVPPPLRR
jgi:nucleotide-binding universal stress UspA family protein